MNAILKTFSVLFSVALFSLTCLAGPQGDRGERPSSGEGPRFGGRNEFDGPGRGFRPPPHPLMAALDTSKDGKLSAEEISAAAVALATLDKNGDGVLGREELRPAFGPRDGFEGEGRRRRGRGGPDGIGGKPGDFGSRKGQRGEGGRPPKFDEGGEPRRRPRGDEQGHGRRGPDGARFLERIKQMDKNSDGILTKNELPPERAEKMLERLDRNEDGQIDRDELQVLVDRLGGRRGPGGPRGDRPPAKRRPDFEQ